MSMNKPTFQWVQDSYGTMRCYRAAKFKGEKYIDRLLGYMYFSKNSDAWISVPFVRGDEVEEKHLSYSDAKARIEGLS